ncbi:hypothetical protein EES43_18930 [Streptomyces sp. ADI96-02]|uniref:hypothetical protein n=1 Tax=unclassified Streptomyces TaxID=2593676 RepID=UPI000F5572FF|nr:hypothetical protein [Streptomyces sp. ADI96-02]RPK59157.1 hypothetical protein EES43_18930 [Streptomyces sp. ADI96-02]
MSAGFFYSYHLGWTGTDAATLLGDLESEGLRPEHPVTGRTLLVSLAPASSCGSRSPVTRDQLLSLAGLQRLREVGFRLWADERLDLLVRIRRARAGVVVVEFGIGELPEPERERAVSAIRRTVGRPSVLCIGFVVDRCGATAATDWDGVVIEGTAYLDAWPDALAVRDETASRHPQLGVTESVERSPWRVFGSAVLGV